MGRTSLAVAVCVLTVAAGCSGFATQPVEDYTSHNVVLRAGGVDHSLDQTTEATVRITHGERELVNRSYAVSPSDDRLRVTTLTAFGNFTVDVRTETDSATTQITRPESLKWCIGDYYLHLQLVGNGKIEMLTAVSGPACTRDEGFPT